MAGLDTLGDFYKTSGLAPGYVDAVKQGASLNSTIATTAQTQAQTDRYTQETPSFLRTSEATARKGELGNMQGEADAAAGMPGLNAESARLKKQVEVKQAQKAWDDWDPNLKAQAVEEGRKQTGELINIAMEGFRSTGTIVGAANAQAQYVQANAHKLPPGEADKILASIEAGRVKADQKYRNNPQAFYDDMMKQAQTLANSKASLDPKVIGQRFQDEAHMDRVIEQNKGTLAAAGVRAEGGGAEKNENTTVAIRRLAAIIASPNTTEQEKAAAEYELQAHLRFGQQRESSALSPKFNSSKDKLLPARPGTQVTSPSAGGVINLDEPQTKAPASKQPVQQGATKPAPNDAIQDVRLRAKYESKYGRGQVPRQIIIDNPEAFTSEEVRSARQPVGSGLLNKWNVP